MQMSCIEYRPVVPSDEIPNTRWLDLMHISYDLLDTPHADNSFFLSKGSFIVLIENTLKTFFQRFFIVAI